MLNTFTTIFAITKISNEVIEFWMDFDDDENISKSVALQKALSHYASDFWNFFEITANVSSLVVVFEF
jgi:hypothetical protein